MNSLLNIEDLLKECQALSQAPWPYEAIIKTRRSKKDAAFITMALIAIPKLIEIAQAAQALDESVSNPYVHSSYQEWQNLKIKLRMID